MSAAAVLSWQSTGWPSPATPQGIRIATREARNDSNTKASPHVASTWRVTSIPPKSRSKANSARHKSKDFLTDLPVEIRIMVLSYLSPTDLCRCQQVNISWYHVITQDNYLVRKCQKYLKRQKIQYTKNKENYPVTPYVASRSSTGRRSLNSLQNSGHQSLYYLPPSLPTQSSPMTELLNFDRLQLGDGTSSTSHEYSILKHDVRRCLFPEDSNTIVIQPVIYTDSSIKDVPYNICSRESKKRIKRL